MYRLLKVLLLVTVLSALVAPAWAQPVMPLPPPCAPPCVALPAQVLVGVAPAWAVVPTSPKVFYAPNIPANVYHVQNKYYCYYGGVWYQSKRLEGPWGPVTKKLPAALYR